MATHQTQTKTSANSGTERERKFLVRELPPGLTRYPHEVIEQGYLATSQGRSQDGSAEVRVRRAGKRHVLTIKKGRGALRLEKEISLSPANARMLWPLTHGRRVTKVRYTIPCGGLKIELDVYRGKLNGLATAEVEFPSTAAQRRFTRPSWFGREVTGVKALANAELARHAWPRAGGPAKSSKSRKSNN